MYVLLKNYDVLVYSIKSGKHHECSSTYIMFNLVSYKIPTVQ